MCIFNALTDIMIEDLTQQSILWKYCVVILQILFMVGKGYLRPEAKGCRSDTPKQLKRHFLKCVEFDRDDRPLFPEVSIQKNKM